MVYSLIIFGLSFILASLFLPQILIVSYRKKLFDKPEARKLHRTPSSRLGGSCFVPILLFSWTLLVAYILKYEDFSYLGITTASLSGWFFFATGLGMVYIMGLLDDLIELGYKRKFLVQIFGGVMLCMSGVELNYLGGFLGIYEIPFWASVPLTVFLVVYIINAVNMIDGIDGLASGLGILALGVLLYFSWTASFRIVDILLFTSMAGVMISFWYYNVYRRRKRNLKLFMGDSGSLSLGYVLSYGVLVFLNRRDGFDPWAAHSTMVVMAPFMVPCFDIIRVMMVRLSLKQSVFKADRNHIHHKMLRAGFSPLQAMYLLILFSGLFVLVNALLVSCLSATLLFGVDLIIWFLFHYLLNRRIRRIESAPIR